MSRARIGPSLLAIAIAACVHPGGALAQDAKETRMPADPKEAKESKRNVLRLPKGMRFATIKGIDQGVFTLQGNKFPRLAIGDALVVLNRTRDGVAARLKCTGLLLSGDATAELDKTGRGILAPALLGAPVLLESDALRLPEQLAAGPLALDELAAAGEGAKSVDARPPDAVNPSFAVAGGMAWRDATGAPYALSTPIDAPLSGPVLEAAAYAPWIAVAPWLNAFGVEVRYLAPARGRLDTGRGGAGDLSIAYESSGASVGIGIRPAFRLPALSRVGLLFNAYDASRETIRIEGGPRGEASRVTVERSGFSLEGLLEANPARVGVLGVRYAMPIARKVRVEETSAAGKEVVSGKSKGNTLSVYGGVRVALTPLPHAFSWETLGALEVSTETLSTTPALGESTFTTQGLKLSTGISWVP